MIGNDRVVTPAVADQSRPRLPAAELVTAPLGVAVSAAAFVLAFPPYDHGALAWGALVPLFAAARGRPPRAAFLLGYAWGLAALGGVLWWLVSFGVVVWALAASLLAVFPAVALGAAAWAAGDRPHRAAFWLPITWTAVEFLRSQGPLGFPWALVGETQHGALAVAQIASVTGVYGVTFLVVLVNAAVAPLLWRRVHLLPLAAAAAAVAITAAWGATVTSSPPASSVAGRVVTPGEIDQRRPRGPSSDLVTTGVREAGSSTSPPSVASSPRASEETTTIVASVVQPAYAERTHWDPVQAGRDLATLDALTRRAAAEGASLILWPETASPFDIAGDPATLARLGGWARDVRAALVVTSLERGRTNSAFALGPDGRLAGRYDKHRLVPFAETGEDPGRGPSVLPTPAGRLGVAICFESVFPQDARRQVAQGAVLLAVLTNDAWFDRGAAPLQHAAIAPFRAIEEGRYLLRAANAGPSLILDPHGRVLAALPLGASGVLTARVAPRAARTAYGRVGDLFGWLVVLAFLVPAAPRVIARLRAEAQHPTFPRLVVASVLPLAALVAVDRLTAGGAGPERLAVGGAPVPLPALAVLAAAALLSLGRPLSDVGIRADGFVPAAAAALAAVGGLAVVAARAFAAQGSGLPFAPPPGGWWGGGAVQVLVVGFGFEWWLRGLVFARGASWAGPRTAIVWSALLGMLAGSLRGPEAMVWGLCAGVLLGAVRARWPQVPALALAHGAGAVLLRSIVAPW